MIRASTWLGFVVEKNNGGVFPYRPWNPTAPPRGLVKKWGSSLFHVFRQAGTTAMICLAHGGCFWVMNVIFSPGKNAKNKPTHNKYITMTAIFVETFPTHKTKQHDGT